MKYLSTLTAVMVLFLSAVVVLNWEVDPAGIFRTTSFGQQYAKALVTSEHGLLFQKSLDEREFKPRLAEYANQSDCVVIGSSRIMQVSSHRKYRSFPVCEHILNLGVSGAVIQDHVVLTWLALSKNKPKKLILGIDPWTFAYGNDERWKIRYAEQYPSARMAIDGEIYGAPISISRWSNLINAQYTKRSLAHLLTGIKAHSIDPVMSVDEDFGGEASVVLPDGSLVYSAKYIAESKRAVIPTDGGAYKVDGLINDSRAIKLYYNLIKYAKNKGVQVTLLMSPYHQNAWVLKTSSNVKVMEATEVVVRKMGSEMGIAVIGSFKPELTGCRSDEFYDLMHPKASCIARLTTTAG